MTTPYIYAPQPSAVTDFAEMLLACIEETLAGTEAGRPERSCVIPGQVVWDACPCRQLTVSPQTVNFAGGRDNVITNSLSGRNLSACGAVIAQVMFRVVMTGGCVHTSDANGYPPACEALHGDAVNLWNDAHAVLAGIMCCMCPLGDEDGVLGWDLSPQTVVGPQGGCAATQVDVTVDMMLGSFDCGDS